MSQLTWELLPPVLITKMAVGLVTTALDDAWRFRQVASEVMYGEKENRLDVLYTAGRVLFDVITLRGATKQFASKSTTASSPEAVKPTAPESVKPTAPEAVKPTAPESVRPTAPEAVKPTAPEITKPTASGVGPAITANTAESVKPPVKPESLRGANPAQIDQLVPSDAIRGTAVDGGPKWAWTDAQGIKWEVRHHPHANPKFPDGPSGAGPTTKLGMQVVSGEGRLPDEILNKIDATYIEKYGIPQGIDHVSGRYYVEKSSQNA